MICLRNYSQPDDIKANPNQNLLFKMPPFLVYIGKTFVLGEVSVSELKIFSKKSKKYYVHCTGCPGSKIPERNWIN